MGREAWQATVHDVTKDWTRLKQLSTQKSHLALTETDDSCESEIAQSCLTLCNHLDCNRPGYSIHTIFQARVLEWVAISFFRGSSRPRDQTRASSVSCIEDGLFTR